MIIHSRARECFDAVVLGGGPAGAATALRLARLQRSVCLVEAAPRERVGETLPPEINPILQEWRLTEAFHALSPMEAPGIVSAWGSPHPHEQDFLRNPHGPGWHVDRDRFDEMLCREAAAAGVARSAERPSARFVIDATGRGGGERAVDDRLVAIVLRAVIRSADQRTYIEAAPGGWWYSGPTSAMFFTDPDVYAEEGIVLEEQLRSAALTAARLCDAEVLESYTVSVPSSCRNVIARAGWLAVGDSASAYDPLSGRGVYKALRHATAAANAVHAALSGGEAELLSYAEMVRAEYDRYCSQRREYYSAESRWRDLPFWRRRRAT